MEFTYAAYKNLIISLKVNGYEISSYENWRDKKCAILRHDIDFSVEKALEFAKIENELDVKSTYFVLLTSDFYNVFSARNLRAFNEICNLGHTIGLHFDETRYSSIQNIEENILRECEILEKAIERPISVVSMHRPSREVLGKDLKLHGIINSYSDVFFNEFKYLSDSRRRWREPVEKIIEEQKYDKLHILTHAFWYNAEDMNLHDSVKQFLDHAVCDRYAFISENITDIQNIVSENEI